MESLVTDVDRHGQELVLFLAQVPSVEDWRRAVVEWPAGSDEGFALLIAGDLAHTSTATIGELADWCMRHGVFSVSVWGSGCERVHDIFDEVDVQLSLTPERSDDHSVVMTSWHADESLSEAMEFFWTHSIVSNGKRWGSARIVLVVGSSEFAAHVREWASSP